jgi:hypothetical protein
MTTESPNDDDFDFDTADRGDDIPTEADEDESDGESADSGRQRDENGRFKKADEGDAAESESEDETDAAENDGEDEAEDEDEDEDEDASGKKQNFPVRLNKAKAQRDRERARADLLQEQLNKALAAPAGDKAAAQPTEADDPIAKASGELDALYEKVEEARADGEVKEAAKLQRQIDALNRQIAKAEAAQVAEHSTRKSTELQRFDAMLDVVESRVPELDPRHADFDREAADDLGTMVVGFERAGMTPTAALSKAMKLAYKIDLAKPPVEDTSKAKVKEAPAQKKADAAKAVDTAKRQPPDAGDRGVNRDSTKIRIAELSDADFDKLPESKKAELRGDYA